MNSKMAWKVNKQIQETELSKFLQGLKAKRVMFKGL